MIPIYCGECGKECDVYLFPEKDALKIEYFCPECKRKCAVLYVYIKRALIYTRDHMNYLKLEPEQVKEKVKRIENEQQ